MNKFNICKGLFQKNISQNQTYYITASPKSGSSFISLVLANIIGVPLVDLVYSHFREQDLYLPYLDKFEKKVTLSKHHTLATTPNLELFQKFNITPIVLTRNLPDTIVSLRDHISKTLRWPYFHVPLDFGNWESKHQFDFLIEFATPWYIFFYVSWNQVILDKSLKIKNIRYEDLNNNEVETITEVLEFLNFDISNHKIEASILKVKKLSSNQNRLNKGVMDRGKQMLSKQQMDKIESFTTFYPEIDFQPIL